jgi:hypothetical protein
MIMITRRISLARIDSILKKLCPTRALKPNVYLTGNVVRIGGSVKRIKDNPQRELDGYRKQRACFPGSLRNEVKEL